MALREKYLQRSFCRYAQSVMVRRSMPRLVFQINLTLSTLLQQSHPLHLLSCQSQYQRCRPEKVVEGDRCQTVGRMVHKRLKGLRHYLCHPLLQQWWHQWSHLRPTIRIKMERLHHLLQWLIREWQGLFPIMSSVVLVICCAQALINNFRQVQWALLNTRLFLIIKEKYSE